MNWPRLKNMQCPKCDDKSPVQLNAHQTGYVHKVCGFFITKGKFEAIINKLYHPKKTVIESDNQEGLNNL